MFRDPLCNDAVFTRLELLPKHNFNIESINYKSDLKIELSRTMSRRKYKLL